MPTISLTDLSLRSLRPGEYWDAKLPTFGVRIGKNAKTFLVKKNNSRVKIGRYPALALATARLKAMGVKAAAETLTGADIALGEAKQLFLSTHCSDYRPRSRSEAERLLKKLGKFDKRKLDTLTTHEVQGVVDAQRAPSVSIGVGSGPRIGIQKGPL